MKDLIRVLENMESLERVIIENAPHGSGINYDYNNIRVEHYSSTNENKVIFENAFHCINDSGFYDGILPFRIVVGSSLVPSLHFLGLNGAGYYRVKKYGLREYLEDVFAEWIDRDEELLEVLTRIL